MSDSVRMLNKDEEIAHLQRECKEYSDVQDQMERELAAAVATKNEYFQLAAKQARELGVLRESLEYAEQFQWGEIVIKLEEAKAKLTAALEENERIRTALRMLEDGLV